MAVVFVLDGSSRSTTTVRKRFSGSGIDLAVGGHGEVDENVRAIHCDNANLICRKVT